MTRGQGKQGPRRDVVTVAHASSVACAWAGGARWAQVRARGQRVSSGFPGGREHQEGGRCRDAAGHAQTRTPPGRDQKAPCAVRARCSTTQRILSENVPDSR